MTSCDRSHGLSAKPEGAVKYSNAAAVVKEREREREQNVRVLGFQGRPLVRKEIMTRSEPVVDGIARGPGAI